MKNVKASWWQLRRFRSRGVKLRSNGVQLRDWLHSYWVPMTFSAFLSLIQCSMHWLRAQDIGIMIWANLNLQYLRMLPFKFELSWPNSFWEEDFLYIFLCKTWSPRCGPALPQGTMIWTNLNLHYLRMLPQKYQLLRLISFWEEDLNRLYVLLCKNLTPL